MAISRRDGDKPCLVRAGNRTNFDEAEVVKGVEDSDNTDEMEVETREVPEMMFGLKRMTAHFTSIGLALVFAYAACFFGFLGGIGLVLGVGVSAPV